VTVALAVGKGLRLDMNLNPVKSLRTGRFATVHGLGGTLTGHSWANMLKRCYAINNPKFASYGKRGIKVCKCLQASPVNLVWLIGLKPDGKSLDRRDNEGHYSCGKCVECIENNWPMNVRWATPKEQARNTRKNRLVKIGEETKCVAEWAEHFGISRKLFCNRLRRGEINDSMC
jgi:hypothetical protein